MLNKSIQEKSKINKKFKKYSKKLTLLNFNNKQKDKNENN